MKKISISKEQAQALDEMLISCKTKVRYYHFKEPDEDKFDKLCVTATILSQIGYIRILTKQGGDLIVSINDEGVAFISNDSFMSQLENEEEKQREKEEKRKKEEIEHQLTIKKLRAAQREPYLIAWSIIATATTIILSIMQLLGKQ